MHREQKSLGISGLGSVHRMQACQNQPVNSQEVLTWWPTLEKEVRRSLRQTQLEVSTCMTEGRGSWLVTGGQVTQLLWVRATREKGMWLGNRV